MSLSYALPLLSVITMIISFLQVLANPDADKKRWRTLTFLAAALLCINSASELVKRFVEHKAEIANTLKDDRQSAINRQLLAKVAELNRDSGAAFDQLNRSIHLLPRSTAEQLGQEAAQASASLAALSTALESGIKTEANVAKILKVIEDSNTRVEQLKASTQAAERYPGVHSQLAAFVPKTSNGEVQRTPNPEIRPRAPSDRSGTDGLQTVNPSAAGSSPQAARDPLLFVANKPSAPATSVAISTTANPDTDRKGGAIVETKNFSVSLESCRPAGSYPTEEQKTRTINCEFTLSRRSTVDNVTVYFDEAGSSLSDNSGNSSRVSKSEKSGYLLENSTPIDYLTMRVSFTGFFAGNRIASISLAFTDSKSGEKSNASFRNLPVWAPL